MERITDLIRISWRYSVMAECWRFSNYRRHVCIRSGEFPAVEYSSSVSWIYIIISLSILSALPLISVVVQILLCALQSIMDLCQFWYSMTNPLCFITAFNHRNKTLWISWFRANIEMLWLRWGPVIVLRILHNSGVKITSRSYTLHTFNIPLFIIEYRMALCTPLGIVDCIAVITV